MRYVDLGRLSSLAGIMRPLNSSSKLEPPAGFESAGRRAAIRAPLMPVIAPLETQEAAKGRPSEPSEQPATL